MEAITNPQGVLQKSPLQTIMTEVFDALHTQNLDKLMGHIAEDALLIDPHYPVINMEGKRAIRNGLEWAFSGMKEFGFNVQQIFESEDGQRAAIEMQCSHVIKAGKRFDFQQVWIVDITGDKLSRLQAFVPYGPNGMHGLILGITRVVRKAMGSDKN